MVAYFLAMLFMCSPITSYAQTCGDADGSDELTVTDGVAVLRAAAGLPSSCSLDRCDVDGSGVIGVSDGVNVLRAAAGLPASLNCGFLDPFISTVQSEDGNFGTLTKIPGGLTAPVGAPTTVTNVAFSDSFVAGKLNTITVEYDVGEVLPQAATAAPSLLVASAQTAQDPSLASFDIPLQSGKGTVTLALDLKPSLSVQQFALKIANGIDGTAASQIFSTTVVVLRESTSTCGNRVVDSGESCDPPGFGCPLSSGGGFCSASCSCQILERFVDNGDGTVTDNQTGLQWEKKTGTFTSPKDCSLVACPDPHNVNNRYQWCRNANHDQDGTCDNSGFPPDGGAFTDFVATLNTSPCFAGHCDWRLPSVLFLNDGSPEFETIVDFGNCRSDTDICIDPIFGPTAPSFYWSSTTVRDTDPSFDKATAAVIFFNRSPLGEGGHVDFQDKGFTALVRAVRGEFHMRDR